MGVISRSENVRIGSHYSLPLLADTNYHIGNNSFRHLVESYHDRYWAATNRKDKSQMIAAIIHTWRSQNPGGRFLIKTDPTMGDQSLWHDVGDQV